MRHGLCLTSIGEFPQQFRDTEVNEQWSIVDSKWRYCVTLTQEMADRCILKHRRHFPSFHSEYSVI